jgi:hypothetical protein
MDITVIVPIQKTNSQDVSIIEWEVHVELSVYFENIPVIGGELYLEDELREKNILLEDPIRIVNIVYSKDRPGELMMETIQHSPIITR